MSEKLYCIDDYVGKPLKGHEDLHKNFDFADKKCLEMFLYHFENCVSAIQDFNYGFSSDKPVHIGEVLCRNMMAIVSFQLDQVCLLLRNCIGNVSQPDQSAEASLAE